MNSILIFRGPIVLKHLTAPKLWHIKDQARAQPLTHANINFSIESKADAAHAIHILEDFIKSFNQ